MFGRRMSRWSALGHRSTTAAVIVTGLALALVVPAAPAPAAPPVNPSDAQIAAAEAQRRADTAALGRVAGQIAAVEGEINRMQTVLDVAVVKYNAATVAVQDALATTRRRNTELSTARSAVETAHQNAILEIRATFTSHNRSGSTLLTSEDPNSSLIAVDVRRYVSQRRTSAITDLARAQVTSSNAEAAARAAEAEQIRLQTEAGRQRDAVIAGLRGFQSRKVELGVRRTALNKQAAAAYGRLKGLKDQRAAYTAWVAEQARLRLAEQRRQAALARQRAALARQQAELARQRAEQQGRTSTTTDTTSVPMSVPVGPPAAGGAWGNPMHAGTYSISSCFCARWGTFHWGVDFAANLGTPMYAIGAGTVIAAGPAQGFGNWVVIDHGNGASSVYGHMRVLAVQYGQHVSRGQLIAYVGTEGDSTGPHLHLEIRLGGINGTKVDPQVWLAQRGVYV